nr:helix-turn-helix transcriptional regulator [uncultured Microbacterium sp.]
MLPLGPRVRALRTQRGLTLVQLAALADLSHPFLSQLERGLARPSMASLEKIASALGTSVVELLADERGAADEVTAVSIVRADDGVIGGFGSGLGRVLVSGARRPFRPIEYTGENAEWGEVVAHAEDEFLHVIEGTIELELGGVVYRLGPRDSAYTPGGTGHRWRGADGQPYRLIVVKESGA